VANLSIQTINQPPAGERFRKERKQAPV